ncbi:MAG TPA: helix-turn-helix domain-containing protein [Gallionella sp.]|nr:helix-turn-helix domain-containing protein [Gallionella sp.]
MDAIDIIYLLRRLGKSQAQLARELGVSGGVVNNVIHDRITAHAVASHIAALLGSEVGELWPDRYVFKPRGRTPPRSEAKQTECEANGGVQ